jgi:hypothetical protein
MKFAKIFDTSLEVNTFIDTSVAGVIEIMYIQAAEKYVLYYYKVGTVIS